VLSTLIVDSVAGWLNACTVNSNPITIKETSRAGPRNG
jgi:hypothetical protein